VLLALEAQAEAAGRAEVVPGELDPLGTIALIPFGIDVNHVLPLVAGLRNAGERVDLELRGRKIGKAMKWANSSGASFTVVVGPKDLEAGQAMVKSLSSGEQQAVRLTTEAIASAIQAMR
ncbi:MAG: His/Gly/Thr/Pro-type tRNA ligase C-terminal domain-containing protein, partial [Candidatus Poseidoniaceae archaeon]|nr:His/Gly/Thr/Pro-type tRNA ligase C-terminal domain-containing protein [Candidatus Poseidoniaceae archaeon]